MRREKFAVLGLGVFGSTIATNLAKHGFDVIAIDLDETCVERVAPFCDAVQADFTDIYQIRELGIEDVDCAVIATGSYLEQSILGVMNLQELGVPYIIAKAKNGKYKKVLEKLGVHKVIRPEKEMGERVAKLLETPNLNNIIDLDENTMVADLIPPQEWLNKSIVELNLRYHYEVNVIGIKRNGSNKLNVLIQPNTVIHEGDTLVLICTQESLSKISVQTK